MTFEAFIQLAQVYGPWAAMAITVVVAFTFEIVVPGRVRDRDVAAAEARTKEWQARCDRWEGTALRLTTLVERTTDAMREMKDALLGRRDQV